MFLAEWIDPPYCGGHWIPEMIEARRWEERDREGERAFAPREMG